jgi:peroxin-3
MLSATRRWFQRNRTPIAIGVGVVGAGYAVTQYVLSRINDARERMSSDRIAKEKYDLYLRLSMRPLSHLQHRQY